jgi:ABC-type transport system involved in cytochrome bd biosynthesis fused ATPase/permease subunit
MEFSQFDRHPAYASAPDADRRAEDRRAGLRREADREERVRNMAAFIFAFCGGLAVLYVFFAAIGAVDLGDAIVATVAALVLAMVWLFAFWRRLGGDALRVQRPDRERRGF